MVQSLNKQQKLLDQVRYAIRTRHYSIRTEDTYVSWIRRYILFHNKRHPKEMGETEINQFLTYLAVKENVAAATQNQALCAIVFLYTEVLKQELGDFGDVVWAKKPKRLPVVFSRQEVKSVLGQLSGVKWIMGYLLYGAGLRLMECLRLRVQDIDFSYNQINVHDGKGKKDRRTMLPEIVKEPLRKHLEKVKIQHEKDLEKGFGTVYLPYALAQKYLNAKKSWYWQYVFPSNNLSIDPRSGVKQRHHLGEIVLQRAVKVAISKAEINKHAGCAIHCDIVLLLTFLKMDMTLELFKNSWGIAT